MDKPKPANFLANDSAKFSYVEKSSPQSSNLSFLTYGVYELKGAITSGACAHPGEEALLFCWRGAVDVQLDGKTYSLDYYDTLYIPRGATYRLSQIRASQK